MKKIPLYIQIMLGLVAGLVWGLISASLKLSPFVTLELIKPIGTIFVNLLKMIAVPLVLASLFVGVTSLHDIRKLSRIGGKTMGIYIGTTVLAIAIGLVLGNLIKPGERLSESTREELMSLYSDNTANKVSSAEQLKDMPILQPLIDMVPDNVFAASADNTRMLQMVFFAVILGVSAIYLPESKRQYLTGFFDALNDAVTKMVDFIMIIAPFGVFALISSLIVEIAGDDISEAISLLQGLGWYALTVVAGLAIHTFVVYPLLFATMSKMSFFRFFKGIRPVQLLAFSTSSSNATLPLTMQRCRDNLDVPEEICSFVLPLGATINMDGTSLYQGVAALFIAQALGIDLTLSDQLVILLTATLASIGSAGVPGAGLVMLIIVLESIHVPAAGIALILAVDRILDMCRTTVNVTGDAAVAVVIAALEGKRANKE